MHEQQETARHGSVRDGLRQIRKSDTLRTVIIIVFVISIFGLNLSTLTPILANYVLNALAGAFGLLCAATGVGSVAAATMMAYRSRFGVGGLLFGTSDSGMRGPVAQLVVAVVTPALRGAIGHDCA